MDRPSSKILFRSEAWDRLEEIRAESYTQAHRRTDLAEVEHPEL